MQEGSDKDHSQHHLDSNNSSTSEATPWRAALTRRFRGFGALEGSSECRNGTSTSSEHLTTDPLIIRGYLGCINTYNARLGMPRRAFLAQAPARAARRLIRLLSEKRQLAGDAGEACSSCKIPTLGQFRRQARWTTSPLVLAASSPPWYSKMALLIHALQTLGTTTIIFHSDFWAPSLEQHAAFRASALYLPRLCLFLPCFPHLHRPCFHHSDHRHNHQLVFIQQCQRPRIE